MKSNSRIKGLGLMIALVAVTAILFIGCSKSSTSDKTATSASKAAAETSSKTKISVGIGNSYSPFCFLDENGKEAGYDYEVICALADLLADKYEFVINPDDFSNLLIGLDTKKYDIAAHHFGYTTARAENYLYANEGDMYFGNFRIGFLKGRTGISDMKSLKGLTVICSSGSMAETLVLDWNKANPDYQIELAYSPNKEAWYAGLTSGLYDSIVATEYDMNVFSSQYNDCMEMSDYKVTADTYNCGTYFIYNKGSDELQKDIDQGIIKLREDGTLSTLSVKWLGEDYTENPNK